ncbi:MAG TPA: hypothetical protein VLF68_05025 [Candidatus Saccharimonadales bacterium]|nr:hypothetical protein [Candidatus Saccharimonadales bacterium]
MIKKQLEQLVSQSYTQNNLDSEKVSEISKNLKRSELKQYIKALKAWEKSHSVTITLPSPLEDDSEHELFANIYPDKKLIFVYDPKLLVGVKITNNDLVYSADLKDILENISQYLHN